MVSKTPVGIEVRGNAIRIKFTYRGVRCRPTLKGITATKANIKFAEQKRNTILYEINNGSFDYAAHFPHCPKGRFFSPQRAVMTLEQALDDYLAIKKTNLAPGTFRSYRNKSEKYIRPLGDNKRLVSDFTASDIEFWIETEMAHLSNKSINEVLIVARGIFKRAYRDGHLRSNPFEHIDSKPILKEEPDPFTRDEIERILTTKTRYNQERNILQVAIWSGLSISEYFGIAWEDIDQANWTAKVRRVKVDATWKVPKTSRRERVIELLDPAIEALKRQKELNYMLAPIEVEVLQRDNKTKVRQEIRPVLRNTNTGQAHTRSSFLRFYTGHLRAAKVRFRGPNHCRHSFASQLLTLGVSKEWIAYQMGHSSTKMIEQHYGKWITEDAPPMAKMVSEMLRNGPSVAQENQSRS